jgi:hypothetical protein
LARRVVDAAGPAQGAKKKFAALALAHGESYRSSSNECCCVIDHFCASQTVIGREPVAVR